MRLAKPGEILMRNVCDDTSWVRQVVYEFMQPNSSYYVIQNTVTDLDLIHVLYQLNPTTKDLFKMFCPTVIGRESNKASIVSILSREDGPEVGEVFDRVKAGGVDLKAILAHMDDLTYIKCHEINGGPKKLHRICDLVKLNLEMRNMAHLVAGDEPETGYGRYLSKDGVEHKIIIGDRLYRSYRIL